MQNMSDLAQYDWDFQGVADWELVACCHYEFARESKTIVGFYDHQKPCDQCFGECYRAKIGGKLMAFPNPFRWPWVIETGTVKFDDSDPLRRGWITRFRIDTKAPLEFARTPWQSLRMDYRKQVASGYEPATYLAYGGFTGADSVRMARDIISRGDSRSGLDPELGIERIAVEIDWAAFDDL